MLSFFRNLFGLSKSQDSETPKKNNDTEGDPMKKYLIVGLGNIGSDYEHTRHNIGFKIVDYLAKQNDLTWETAKLGAITTHKKKGADFYIIETKHVYEPEWKSHKILAGQGENSTGKSIGNYRRP